MLLAWPIFTTFSGRFIIRYGYRPVAVLGALLITLGLGMVTLYKVGTGLPFVIVSMLVIGAGLGMMSISFQLAVQNAVPWRLRGVSTAAQQFFRSIGGTIGVAVMGSILNAQMALSFTPIFANNPGVVATLPKGLSPSNVLLTPTIRDSLPSNFLLQLETALAHSLFWLFLLMLILAIVGLACMFLLPGGRADEYRYQEESGEEAERESGQAEVEIATFG